MEIASTLTRSVQTQQRWKPLPCNSATPALFSLLGCTGFLQNRSRLLQDLFRGLFCSCFPRLFCSGFGWFFHCWGRCGTFRFFRLLKLRSSVLSDEPWDAIRREIIPTDTSEPPLLGRVDIALGNFQIANAMLLI